MKTGAYPLILAALILAACGSDSGNGADSDAIAEVKTIYSLGACKGANEGVTKFVTSEDAYYTCFNGVWETEGASDSKTEKEGVGQTEKDEIQSSSSSQAIANRVGCTNDVKSSTLVDSRDGQTYRTVKICDQVWMAENLNFKTEFSWCAGGIDDTEGDCFDNGRLYTWSKAVEKNGNECDYGNECGSSAGDIRGVCPQGWHLPSWAEWEKLIVVADGSITKYTYYNTAAPKLMTYGGGWDMSGIENMEGAKKVFDIFGFSARPVGYREELQGIHWDGPFQGLGRFVGFWSSTEFDKNLGYALNLNFNNEKAILNYYDKNIGLSVRCLKDEGSSSTSNKNDIESFSSSVSSSSSKDESSSSLGGSSESNAECEGSVYDAVSKTLKDCRDGKVYRTTQIGDEIWMAENLAYEMPPKLAYEEPPKYSGVNWDDSSGTKYGRLYNWYGARSACPTGWHLPVSFKNLFNTVGGKDVAGKMLKSISGWDDCKGANGNGTDIYSFSAVPVAEVDGGYKASVCFWSNNGYAGSDYAFVMCLRSCDNLTALQSSSPKEGWNVVRCLKDD